MMHSVRFLALFLLCFAPFRLAYCTPTIKDSTSATEAWNHDLVLGFGLTQVSFTDWEQGGENSLSYRASLEGKSVRAGATITWSTDYKFIFGQTRSGTQGMRKNDDRIDVESVVSYDIGTYVNPFASLSIQTQFAKGFKYGKDGGREAVSEFFDPAYITQYIGVGYMPVSILRIRLGFALRETIVSRFTIYTDEPGTEQVEKFRIDGGPSIVTELEWKLDDNILLKSKLNLFAPIRSFDHIIVRSDNSLSARVNRFLSVDLELALINERDISPRTQIKQSIAVGLNYAIW
jgi:Protein of unknown function (DUF3078)